MDISRLKEVISDSGELSKTGRLDDAIHLIDAAIADAEEQGDIVWLRTLNRHAYAICRSLGRLGSARQPH